jgi:predicted DNA-binding protein (MmcQ/YjbR family)
LIVTRDDLLAYCLAKPGAWRDEPWQDAVVIKVGPKIFAFFGGDDSDTVGVKCGRSRDEADEWLHRHPQDARVMPYLGRSGWNSLTLDRIPDDELVDAVDDSYHAVIAGLPRKHRPGNTGQPDRRR